MDENGQGALLPKASVHLHNCHLNKNLALESKALEALILAACLASRVPLQSMGVFRRSLHDKSWHCSYILLQDSQLLIPFVVRVDDVEQVA